MSAILHFNLSSIWLCNQIVKVVPGVVESQSFVNDKASEFESKITITKLTKSQQREQSFYSQYQLIYSDVPLQLRTQHVCLILKENLTD